MQTLFLPFTLKMTLDIVSPKLSWSTAAFSFRIAALDAAAFPFLLYQLPFLTGTSPPKNDSHKVAVV